MHIICILFQRDVIITAINNTNNKLFDILVKTVFYIVFIITPFILTC